MNELIDMAQSRRCFLQLVAIAAASAGTPNLLYAQQGDSHEPVTFDAASSGVKTFEDVWRTVRDRFYDPHLNGLDWSAVRDRFMPAAARASTEEEVAGVINSMLSELHASHTRYYTPDEPEFYQLADIFASSLRRRGLEQAFPGGRIGYPGIGILSSANAQRGSRVIGVIEGAPAHQAGLLVDDEITSADGAPFQPVRSFRDKVGKPVVLTLRRSGAAVNVAVTPVELEPNKMFLDGMNASAHIIQANGRRIGYVHIWSYAGYSYQRALERLISLGVLSDADALVWDLRDGWGGAVPEYLDLFNARAPTMQVTDHDGDKEFENVKWRKPVAMLVNAGTRSGKEVLAYGFKKYKLGEVIGTRTEGAVLAATAFLIGRGLLLLAVEDVLVDGERLEGVGVAPTIEVPAGPPSVDGSDPQLGRAVAVLSNV